MASEVELKIPHLLPLPGGLRLCIARINQNKNHRCLKQASKNPGGVLANCRIFWVIGRRKNEKTYSPVHLYQGLG